MEIKVRKICSDAKLPTQAYVGDLGFDLYAVEDKIIGLGCREAINTGIQLELPYGYGFLIKDKSGIAGKHGIHVIAGVIDNAYRGDILVCMINLSNKPYGISSGDKIAQGVILPQYYIDFVEVKELSYTTRGDKGFGSSGKT